ncbi:hypothetical protein D3C79_864650 [compost metagenome]
MLNPHHRAAANRQASLFAAFAHHPHFAGLQIEVFDIKVYQLRQTQPGTVHHFQHRPIAHCQRIVQIDIQQAINVINIDIFRQMARCFGCRDPFSRVRLELALADHPVEEAA